MLEACLGPTQMVDCQERTYISTVQLTEACRYHTVLDSRVDQALSKKCIDA